MRHHLTSRPARIVAALLIAFAIITSPVLQTRASADSYDNQIAQLRQQIAQLRGQMGAVGAQQQAAANAAAATQQLIDQTQTQLAATQAHLNSVNAAIAVTTTQLATVTAQLATDRQKLATIVQNIYEMQNTGLTVEIVLNSSDFSTLTQSLISLNRVNTSMTTLAEAVKADQQRITDLRNQQLAELADVTATMNSLQALQAQQEAQEVAYQRESAALSGQAAAINHQIATLQGKIASLQAQQAAAAAAGQGGWIRVGNALPPFAFGARFDAFPWGQCTWYVASLRDVSWSGDAWAWAGNARAQGRPEGMTPQAGAIVVWGAGNGYSEFGHVGYVASVLSPTSFVVDEGNYLGLGIVDQRMVPSLHDVEAFIY